MDAKLEDKLPRVKNPQYSHSSVPTDLPAVRFKPGLKARGLSKLHNKIWWSYLEEGMQELLTTSVFLIEKVGKWDQKFHDYSFVVFPAAKAFEGFLKKLFLDLGFIDENDYYGKRFRIGGALNPSLETEYRHESVYDKLVDYCSSSGLASQLWQTWKESRNLLFHWFPDERNAISYNDAKARVNLIIDSMDLAFSTCKLEQNGKTA